MRRREIHKSSGRYILTLCFVGMVCAGRIYAEPMLMGISDSIFYVDGLMADELINVDDQDLYRIDLLRPPWQYPRNKVMFSIKLGDRDSSIMGSQPAEPTLDFLAAANSYVRDRNWEAALVEIQRALVRDPDNLDLVQKAAALAALARKFGVADGYFRRYVEAHPENITYMVGWAGVLIRLYRFDEAETVLKRALAVQPDNLAAQFNMACLQVAKGDVGGFRNRWTGLPIVEMLNVANWLDADKQDLQTVLGTESYTKICEMMIGAGTQDRMSEVVRALASISQAYGVKDLTRVVQELAAARNLGVDALTLDLELARCMFEMGQQAEASEKLTSLADRNPDVGRAWYSYGYVLTKMQSYAKAELAFVRARKLLPNDGQTAFALACAYAGQGKIDEAWPLLLELKKTHPGELPQWLEGDSPYLQAIRQDSRYKDLVPVSR